MDQSVAEKMLYYNREMPIRIRQWRVVPIEGDDRWRDSVSLKSKC